MDVLHTERSDLAAQSDGPTVESSRSAVAWAAIICGAVVAASTSLILIALGSGFGLASVSPWAEAGVSPTTFAVATAIWLIVTQWIASAAGGYLTGRLRTKWVEIHTHEVFFRDTAHGFVTWALASIIAAIVLSFAASSLAGLGRAPAQGASTTTVRGSGIGDAYEADVLFRGISVRNPTATDPRPEAMRILANGLQAGGDVSPADRGYLATLVSARTGISEPEAANRVGIFISHMKASADSARKAASAASLFTALSMLIGAFIACAAAALGGRERDASVVPMR
jgi:hypothetical protein